MIPISDLIARYAQEGRIARILERPARLAEPVSVQTAMLALDGLSGDHARPGNRAVTLIQAEHLPVIAALAGLSDVDPALLRRNLVVSGINLSGLRGVVLSLGPEARLEITGPCAPCSRMEAALGFGGYAAMRGHGGWCATVHQSGPVSVGDNLRPLPRAGQS